MNCKMCQSAFPDLLLEPSVPLSEAAVTGSFSSDAESDASTRAVHVRLDTARVHLAGCAGCAREFAALEATVALLDAWSVPDISPYFDQKLAVRLREDRLRQLPDGSKDSETA